MKVVKTISIEQGLWNWFKENRPEFRDNHSQAISKILESSAGPIYSAEEAEARRIAQALAKANFTIEKTKLERDSLLEQMKFIERRKVKKK